MIKRIFKILLILAGCLMLLLFVATGWLWIQHNQTVSLPEPPGPYSVGRAEYEWTDPARIDPLASKPEQHRRLTVWIWYPAEDEANMAKAPYLRADWIRARFPTFSFASFLMQNLTKVQTHSIEGAPVAKSETPYPVLVMQPGMGPIASDYSSLTEGLASQGYVVIGSNPTYSASVVVFQDGTKANGTPAGNVPDSASPAEAETILDRLIQVWAADDRFVLDKLEQLNAEPSGRFKGQLDLKKVGFFGHSFGGATAAQVCSEDTRCTAGADLDGYPYGSVVQTGLQQPFLFIWSEPVDPKDPAWQQALKDSQAMNAKSPNSPAPVMIQGTRHFNFTDEAIFYAPIYKMIGALGPIDGRKGLEITIQTLTSFFDRYLRSEYKTSRVNERAIIKGRFRRI